MNQGTPQTLGTQNISNDIVADLFAVPSQVRKSNIAFLVDVLSEGRG